jgi:hypothetical protein
MFNDEAPGAPKFSPLSFGVAGSLQKVPQHCCKFNNIHSCSNNREESNKFHLGRKVTDHLIKSDNMIISKQHHSVCERLVF